MTVHTVAPRQFWTTGFVRACDLRHGDVAKLPTPGTGSFDAWRFIYDVDPTEAAPETAEEYREKRNLNEVMTVIRHAVDEQSKPGEFEDRMIHLDGMSLVEIQVPIEGSNA